MKEQTRVKALLSVLFPKKKEPVPAEAKDWAETLLAGKKNILSGVSEYYLEASKQWSKDKKYELFKTFWDAHMEKGYLSDEEGFLLLLWAKEWKIGRELMESLRSK